MPGPAQITWLGHSSVLVELDGLRVLTDPVVRRHLGPLVRTAAPVCAELLRDIDLVLISHLHADHADPASLRRVGTKVPAIAPVGAAGWLRQKGLSDVRELGQARATAFGPLEIAAVPALHDGRRHQLGPDAHPTGFLIRGSHAVYFAGDTDLFPEMAELAGDVDLALLPVGGWGPSLGPGHLDPARAAQAARLIAPRIAIPIHWGTLALPWAAHRAGSAPLPGWEFAEHAGREAPGVEVRVLPPGGHTTLA